MYRHLVQIQAHHPPHPLTHRHSLREFLLDWCEYLVSHKVWYISYVPLLAVVY